MKFNPLTGNFDIDTGLTQAQTDLLYQPLDIELSAIASLVSAADKLAYFTGSGTATLTTLTNAGRALIDDADAAAQRTTLGLGSVDNTSDLNKPVSTATQTALDTKVNDTGDTMTGNLILDAGAAAADNARILLKSYEEWTSPTHLGDLIRFQWTNDYYKAAFAFIDKNGVDKWAQVGHDYLTSYSAALDKTFISTDINTGTSVISLTAHGWTTADAVWFATSTFKTADMPDGVAPYRRYFIRAVDSNTVAVYRTSADASADTSRLALTNASASATFTITKNNWHHHISTEIADRSGTLGSDGTLHSRMEYVYDIYPAQIRITDAELQVATQNMRLITDPTANQEIQFGVGPEKSGRRWAMQNINGSSEFRIASYDTTGLNAFSVQRWALATGNTGFGGAPDGTHKAKVYGSFDVTTTISATGNITSGGDIAADNGYFGDASGSARQLLIRTSVASTNRGGTVRFTGESNGFTTYRGGYLTYDPLNNYVELGTHETADELASSDIASLRLDRTTADATFTRPLTITGNTTVNSGDVIINTAGEGLKVKEGSNAKMGTVALVAGTATVSNTSVTSTSVL